MKTPLVILIISAFLINSFEPISLAHAQFVLDLPQPGQRVEPSLPLQAPIFKGVTLDPRNPLKFDFLVYKGGLAKDETGMRAEYNKLLKYFFAALTMPEADLWVNLSPYEKDRIIAQDMGHTCLGGDLLKQDYLLKQLTATLMDPQKELGKEFWQKVYRQAQEMLGTTNVPVNTFNKVWIVPEKAVVYEKGNTAYLVESRLNVMLEEDYLALDKNSGASKPLNSIASRVLREVILPAIKKEVNEGRNFSSLRQIYSAVILAAWYKQTLKESLLGKIYVDRKRTAGVESQDRQEHQKIYQQYLASFKKHVFNFIREEQDPQSGTMVARKYLSGGADLRLTTPASGQDFAALSIVREGSADPAALSRLRQQVDEQLAAIAPDSVSLESRLMEPGEPQQISADAAMATAKRILIGVIGKFRISKDSFDPSTSQLTVEGSTSSYTTEKIVLSLEQEKDHIYGRLRPFIEGADGQTRRIFELIAAIDRNFIPNELPVFYTFNETKEGLLGIADPNIKLIAVHRELADNPLVWLHQIAQYLVATGRMEIEHSYKGLKLKIAVNAAIPGTRTWEEFNVPLNREIGNLVYKSTGFHDMVDKEHYYLRALQRTLTSQMDIDLSSRIDLEQRLGVEAGRRRTSSSKKLEDEDMGRLREVQKANPVLINKETLEKLLGSSLYGYIPFNDPGPVMEILANMVKAKKVRNANDLEKLIEIMKNLVPTHSEAHENRYVGQAFAVLGALAETQIVEMDTPEKREGLLKFFAQLKDGIYSEDDYTARTEPILRLTKGVAKGDLSGDLLHMIGPVLDEGADMFPEAMGLLINLDKHVHLPLTQLQTFPRLLKAVAAAYNSRDRKKVLADIGTTLNDPVYAATFEKGVLIFDIMADMIEADARIVPVGILQIVHALAEVKDPADPDLKDRERLKAFFTALNERGHVLRGTVHGLVLDYLTRLKSVNTANKTIASNLSLLSLIVSHARKEDVLNEALTLLITLSMTKEHGITNDEMGALAFFFENLLKSSSDMDTIRNIRLFVNTVILEQLDPRIADMNMLYYVAASSRKKDVITALETVGKMIKQGRYTYALDDDFVRVLNADERGEAWLQLAGLFTQADAKNYEGPMVQKEFLFWLISQPHGSAGDVLQTAGVLLMAGVSYANARLLLEKVFESTNNLVIRHFNSLIRVSNSVENLNDTGVYQLIHFIEVVNSNRIMKWNMLPLFDFIGQCLQNNVKSLVDMRLIELILTGTASAYAVSSERVSVDSKKYSKDIQSILDSLTVLGATMAKKNISVTEQRQIVAQLKESLRVMFAVPPLGMWERWKFVVKRKFKASAEWEFYPVTGLGPVTDVQKRFGQTLGYYNFSVMMLSSDREGIPAHIATYKKLIENIHPWFLRSLGYRGASQAWLVVPMEMRAAIAEQGLDHVLRGINSGNYQQPVHLAAMYIHLRQSVPSSLEIGFDEFRQIVMDPDYFSEYQAVVQEIVAYMLGQENELTREQQKQVIRLSVALHQRVLDLLGEERKSSIITFRELIRFNVDFSRHYLKEKGLKNTLEYFILTSHNIYGRALKTAQQRKQFSDILIALLTSDEFKGILMASQVQSESMRGDLETIVDRIIDYGNYEQLQPEVREESSMEDNVKALIERAYQVQGASLLVVDDDNTHVVEDVLNGLSGQNSVAVRVAVSKFSKRGEFFGMYMPREALSDGETQLLIEAAGKREIIAALSNIFGMESPDEDQQEKLWTEWNENQDGFLREAVAIVLKYGDSWRNWMEWRDGLLAKMANAASKNSGKRFYLILEDIADMPDRVRLLFNPVLWERQVEIPEQGIMRLPANMQIIMTMHKDRNIEDKSFMNRPLVQYVKEMSEQEKVRFLARKTGIRTDVARAILETITEINNLNKEAQLKFNDALEIGYRTRGIAAATGRDEKDVVNQETYGYLSLRMKNTSTLDGFKSGIKIDVGRKSGEVDFNGLKLKVSQEFVDYARRNPRKNFEQLMLGLYGYAVTELELKVLNQLARAYAFGNRVVQLEGPSGEGKTEVGRVLTRLLGLTLREKTINEETNLGELVGEIRPTKDRRYVLKEAPYIRQIQQGGNVFLFNEINTNEDGGLYNWSFAEMTRAKNKVISEFAADGDGSIVKEARISRNNLWLYTVNPGNFHGRNAVPAHVNTHLAVFYMAQDPGELPQKTLKLFQAANFKGLPRFNQKEYAQRLAKIHLDLREAKAKGWIRSPQDLTPRELIRTIAEFKNNLQQGLTVPDAFAKALGSVYAFMWKERADVTQARKILEDNGIRLGRINAEDILKETLHNSRRPVLVFYNGQSGLEGVLGRVLNGPNAVVIRVPVSFFHRVRQFVGGLTPLKNEQVSSLPESLRAQFEEGLGMLPEIIKQVRLSPGKTHYLVLDQYTHINPKVAPVLNEFLQTGWLPGIDEWVTLPVAEALLAELGRSGEQLSDAQKLAFARQFYGQAPENLKILATASSEEEMNLSPAELDRFQGVNIAGDLGESIKAYLSGLETNAKLKPFANLIRRVADEAFTQYKAQKASSEYPHNRLSLEDIKIFIGELMAQPALSDELVRKIAYYALGAGLRPAYRAKLKMIPPAGPVLPANAIRYEKTDRGIELMVDGIRFPTKFTEVPAREFLAPTSILTRQLAAMLIGLKHRRTLLVEGFPGGGKTSGVEDLAARLGLDFYKEMMFEDIDLGNFLGHMSKEGKQFVLTALKKDNRGQFLIPFLRAYTQGGIYLLDEGAMGINSKEAIAFLTAVAAQPVFDLGTFHPGLWGMKLKRSDDFYLAVSQNPAGTTKEREPLFAGVDESGQKIWTDNILSMEDGLMVMDFYLKEDRDKIPEGLKRQAVATHIFMIQNHPNKDEISPRQLILMTRMLQDAARHSRNLEQAFFEGTMAAYLTGLSEENFTVMWEAVNKSTQGALEGYWEEWLQPIHVAREGNIVHFNGIDLPASSVPGNVEESDLPQKEEISSQNRALRAAALGLKMDMPVAIFEEDGADALGLVRKLAYLLGYQLEIFWSHPQKTRMQLVGMVLPKFEQMLDRYGIKKEDMSGEFLLALGFITRHLQKAGPDGTVSDGVHKILFFHLMDAIPERQRVLLNELLTTRRIELINEKGETVRYVLPKGTHLMVSSGLDHGYSSAFINRFQPVRIGAIRDKQELKLMFKNRYPLVRDEETEWIADIAGAVARFDANEGFGIHYGFSQREVETLAREIHLEKQRDIQQGRFNPNPLYYAAKAIYVLYGLGMQPADYDKFEKLIVNAWLERLAGKGGAPGAVWQAMKKQIKEELGEMQREEYSYRVDTSVLKEGVPVTLENGLTLEWRKDHWVLNSLGANSYELWPQQLGEFKEVSPDIRVKLEDGRLLFHANLIASIGGVPIRRDDYNYNHSVPEAEVPTKDYLKYVSEIRQLASGILRAWQPVEDGLGNVRRSRVVMLNGLTGTAKSTFARNLSRVMGVPMYTLNAYEEMRVSDMSIGLKFQEGKFELGVKEFLARVGKINGRRIAVAGKTTSNRSILLLDEANASPDLLYALAPLFRGEKKFRVEYAGESFEVEIDDEVMVLLTFNPAETYGGRGLFAREITGQAVKLWAPDPLSYDPDTLIEILSEYHRRGITRSAAEAVAALGQTEERHADVQPAVVVVDKTLRHPPVGELSEYLKVSQAQPDKKEEGEKKGPEKVVFKIDYDLNAIEHNAAIFAARDGYKVFAQVILKGYLLALANGESSAGIQQKVLDAARQLSPELVTVLERIFTMYSAPLIREKDLRQKFLELRKVFVHNGNVLLLLQLMVKGGVPYMNIFAEDIQRRVNITADHLKFLGEDPALYKGDNIQAVIVEENPLSGEGTLGYFEGEIAIVMGRRAKTSSLSTTGVPTEAVVDWVAEHEIGHILDQSRIRKLGQQEGVTFTKGMAWSRLAQRVNAFVERRMEEGGLAGQRRLWISKNVELNAMLFPMILSKYAKEYVLGSLIDDLKRGSENTYTQAAKGILNGVLILGGVAPEALITDKFEPERVQMARSTLEKMSSIEINHMAARFYKEPWKYLATALAGAYQIRAKLVDGQASDSSVDEIMAGVDGRPDVDIKVEEGDKDAQGKTIEIETKESKGKKPTFVREPPGPSQPDPGGKGGGKGGPSGEGGGVIDETKGPKSWIKEQMERLIAVNPQRIRRYLEIFAGTPKTRKTYSDSGDVPDLQRLLEGDLEPFASTKVIEGQASLSAGVTVDISGSTHGHLLEIFIRMAKSFTALNYFAGVRNQNLHYSLSAVGDNYHRYLDFEQSKDQTAVEAALQNLENSTDFGGINTVAVINGITEKYKGQMHKKHRLEIVFTDGGETSGKSFDELKVMLGHLEKTMNIDVVFVGIGYGAAEVQNYSKYIYLENTPTEDQMMDLIESLSILKVQRGILPQGDLKKELGLADRALTAEPVRTAEPSSPGGIDLTRAKLPLQIKRDADGVPLPVQMQDLQDIKIDGFIPVITKISPAINSSFYTDR